MGVIAGAGAGTGAGAGEGAGAEAIIIARVGAGTGAGAKTRAVTWQFFCLIIPVGFLDLLIFLLFDFFLFDF